MANIKKHAVYISNNGNVTTVSLIPQRKNAKPKCYVKGTKQFAKTFCEQMETNINTPQLLGTSGMIFAPPQKSSTNVFGSAKQFFAEQHSKAEKHFEFTQRKKM